MNNPTLMVNPKTADFVTILTSPHLKLVKIFSPGGVTQFEKPKNFTVEEMPVTSLADMTELMKQLSHEKHKCVIRGRFVGDAKAQEIDPPEKPGQYHRNSRLFPDVAHHWVMFDIDKYEFDPSWPWAHAVVCFILDHLPEFLEASYCYQLTSSCGRVPGQLKCRLVFWLKTPYNSDQLKAWAKDRKLPVDCALFHEVQPHFTGLASFEDGEVDPIPPDERFGFAEGDVDEVDLLIDEACLARAAQRSETTGMPDACAKHGWIGAFNRAYPAADVVDRFLPHIFEWEGDADGLGQHRRLTFLLGSGAPGGAFITDDGYHIVNKHDSDPFENRAANGFDLVRVYLHGHLDTAGPYGPTDAPSYFAMIDKVCRKDENVVREMNRAVTADELGDGDAEMMEHDVESVDDSSPKDYRAIGEGIAVSRLLSSMGPLSRPRTTRSFTLRSIVRLSLGT